MEPWSFYRGSILFLALGERGKAQLLSYKGQSGPHEASGPLTTSLYLPHLVESSISGNDKGTDVRWSSTYTHVGTCHMPTPPRPLSRFRHLQHHGLLAPKHPTPWTSNEGSGCRWCLVAHKDGYRSKHAVGHPDRSGEGAAELMLCLDHSHGSKRQGITASTCLFACDRPQGEGTKGHTHSQNKVLAMRETNKTYRCRVQRMLLISAECY